MLTLDPQKRPSLQHVSARLQHLLDTRRAPRRVWLDGERLFVCDSGNNRVLLWQRGGG
jgi:hypothetical protein